MNNIDWGMKAISNTNIFAYRFAYDHLGDSRTTAQNFKVFTNTLGIYLNQFYVKA
ncbi:hypothetical protein ACFWMS_27820 [Peribacillus butanolivorans]|uniref:hypothetical protein n=1 Tax=Peribacillus butanolivorans TaxID=421767 RepID=UPI0030C962E4